MPRVIWQPNPPEHFVPHAISFAAIEGRFAPEWTGKAWHLRPRSRPTKLERLSKVS
jgi:hypothetical protein